MRLVPAFFLFTLFPPTLKAAPVQEIPIYFWMPPFDSGMEINKVGMAETPCEVERGNVLSPLSKSCLNSMRRDAIEHGGNALIVLAINPWDGNPERLWVKSLVIKVRFKGIVP